MIHEIFEYCITYIRYAETVSATGTATDKNKPLVKYKKVEF